MIQVSHLTKYYGDVPHPIRGVGDGDLRLFPAAPCCQGNAAAVGRIFEGVVQQDRNHLLNRCAITSHAQAICDILCVCFSLCLHKRNKRLADFPEHIAERKFRADRERILFIQPV